MRIVVTSDSHRRRNWLYDIIDRHIDNTDLFIHCGDGEGDVENIPFVYPDIRFECVAGNCDWGSTLPLWKTVRFADKKVFFCHGHTYGVKHGYEMLLDNAKREGIDICLFGHTHNPYIEKIDGIYLINPGAVCNSSYAVIDIIDGKVNAYHAKI